MIKKCLLAGLFVCTSQSVLANLAQPLTCPSMDVSVTLSSTGQSFSAAFPYGFDNRTQQVKYLGIQSLDQNWVLFIYPIKVQPTEDANVAFKTIMASLKPFSTEPLHFSLPPELSGTNEPFCVYTAPGSARLSAIAYHYDSGNFSESQLKGGAKKHANTMQIMQLAQRTLLNM